LDPCEFFPVKAKAPAVLAKLRKYKRVALLVAGWNHYGRGIIEGAWHYAQNNFWNLDMQPTGPDGAMQMPEGWQGDGIIATVHSSALGKELRSYRVPIVNVSGARLEGVNFPRVTSDANAVIELAAEHLKSKGLRSIAFCGEPERKFLDFWTRAYERVAEKLGLTPLIYELGPNVGPDAGLVERRRDRARWLKSLPKPTGVIGWDTITCRNLANACELAGIEVPDQISIISLSTEDLLGQTIHPPISGVDIPVKRIGYDAASMLDQLIRGRRLATHEQVLRPLGITTRQSTDIFECDDPKIRQVMRFIKDNSNAGINVQDVLRAVPIARRTLEKRFSAILGHSPAEEIRRIKLDKVRQLLSSTDMAIPDIADACGFAYAEHMIPLFARHYGSTPAAFRRNLRGTSAVSSGRGRRAKSRR
jgi:LacI family transcriptional regulator